ncbi:GerAB/ArcD/ProY family transporter [Metabacillus sp. FJAT-53654]|uniref:GerAB/ArcD/ProY family transporter n=1 Tax=Metabacillus rhizosphaerae TaxID=3117747 RepID=A0ABZ2MX97_9BACI
MKHEKISPLQLFYVILGFQIGNTFVFGLGGGAKQDAWLVILVSMLGGFILMLVYTKLSNYYPDDTLIQMIPKIIGKFLAIPFILIYISYFTYLAARACRDFAEILAASMLVKTPLVVVIGSFMVLIVYCFRGGIESFSRMGEAVIPSYIMALSIIWVLLLTVEEFDIKNLTPILGNGPKPILKEVFPKVLTFPFGESIIITMFFPYLNNMGRKGIVGMAAILFTGVLMTVNLIMVLSVLGPEIYSRDFFPLLTAARMVSIADFLERFDALVILTMLAGVFFKIGGWTFGSAVGIAQLFKLKQNRSVFLGLGTILTPLSLLIASNQIRHNEIGLDFFTLYFHIPLQIVFPILLLCIAFIRKKFKLQI